jgi:hypothetical protein
MKSSFTTQMQSFLTKGLRSALLIAGVLALSGAATLSADSAAKVFPPSSIKYGNDYAGWSAAWWHWMLQMPMEGHPSVDGPGFDVSGGQTGNVWFLSAPFGTVERTCTIPAGKALFITLMNVECSSLEPDPFHGDTAKEQRVCAKFWADHIINPFCEIDGAAVTKISSYRVTSPQFSFTAPTPWFFGDTGGASTAVGDGYYVFLSPLSAGAHTIHFGGVFHFTLAQDGFDLDLPIDMTYHLTVE